ncbi:hypothetical protein BCR36DRAFT_306998 [Piromyces finnis]|uniref:Late embryogenesis abundant protein LEA-2 subgroup domain-containing protein n=1 Tax=Piromyces finnis TaxID=1754191 RepID=A0A1Y1UXR0_9FUNG|nr:hypothetical protein BCR36DRAFT_306998 [Piromyces finnis]|eukprot:ORX42482.1 hypothetical protein BCR36DRAFT_306998 [Piromyces finnis]
MYYQQFLLNNYKDEQQQAKELIEKINNDIDLSNVTLSEENETSKNNVKGNSGQLKNKSKKNDDDDNCCCCKCCGIVSCIVIFIFMVCILGLFGFLFYPRIPSIIVNKVEINNITSILTTLQTYNNYNKDIQQVFPLQNLDLTFDFNVTFSFKSINPYNFTFTNVEIELIYPGTYVTPRFHIARGYSDNLLIASSKVTNVTIPFTGVINFQNILSKGYFYNIFSSCTWDTNFKGNTKIFGIFKNYLIFNYSKRLTRTCIIEEILTEFQKLNKS